MEALVAKTDRSGIAIGVSCLSLGALAAFVVTRGTLAGWVVAAVLAIVVVGLVRRLRWAGTWAKVIFWFLLVMGVFYVMPSQEMDQLSGRKPPELAELLPTAIGLVALALLNLHLLGLVKEGWRKAWF
jgi:hypothetical protein